MLAEVRTFPRAKGLRCAFPLLLLILLPELVSAQNWVWSTEVVDTSGTSTSLAADAQGNIHISYGGNEGLKYGFRPFGAKSQWFTMPLNGGVNYTSIGIDPHGNPHICATYLSLPVRYAHYDGNRWDIQQIAPEDTTSAQMACGVAVSPDGSPHVSWYRIASNDPNYKHIKYATLKDGVWLMRTLDYDTQTGKWHTMVVNPLGAPCITYDAFVKGILKLACEEGSKWNIRVVDSRGAHGSDYSLGMGSSLIFDSRGNAHISYYTDTEMRHAWQDGERWKVETVDRIMPSGAFVDYRSSIVFDKDGFLHISYEERGIAKHAYWDGTQWQIQIIAPAGAQPSRFSSMTIDSKHNILYFAYRDARDGSLRVAVGRNAGTPPAVASQKLADQN